MILDEYNTLISLVHPNIIRLYDAFEEESAQYLVMEYCPIGSIKQKGKLTYDQFVNYSRQLLDAISYCHSLNIAHRDIKPDNIFIDKNGNVKLADFGISKHFDYLNKSDQKCGSLKFFSPEMFLCQSICPFKADIWALGVTFFCIATGEYPFKNIYTRDDLKSKIITANFNFDNYELDERIQFLIVKMVRPNPEMRLTAKKLLKLPMFNRISDEKTFKHMGMSSFVGQSMPQKWTPYRNVPINGRERSRSLSSSMFFCQSSNIEEKKSDSPLVNIKTYKSFYYHSPINYIHSTFQSYKLIDVE